jgi:hypothetical protein
MFELMEWMIKLTIILFVVIFRLLYYGLKAMAILTLAMIAFVAALIEDHRQKQRSAAP